MWSICKKEINQFFSSLTGYIAIVLFLLINGIFLFVLKESSILDYGYATLEKYSTIMAKQGQHAEKQEAVNRTSEDAISKSGNIISDTLTLASA